MYHETSNRSTVCVYRHTVYPSTNTETAETSAHTLPAFAVNYALSINAKDRQNRGGLNPYRLFLPAGLRLGPYRLPEASSR